MNCLLHVAVCGSGEGTEGTAKSDEVTRVSGAAVSGTVNVQKGCAEQNFLVSPSLMSW